jgi:putative endonuclease
MSFVVYAIRSDLTGRIYIGQTGRFETRLDSHNCGRVPSTRSDRPWRRFKLQDFPSRSAARWFEYSLKRSRGKREKWLKSSQ